EVESILRERYGIEVELSDLYNVLFLITIGDTKKSVGALVDALREISAEYFDQRPVRRVHVRPPVIPQLVMTPREAFYAQTEEISLFESCGRTMAEFLMVYPPGIPILLPGELITEEILTYIREHLEAGLPVQGTEDP